MRIGLLTPNFLPAVGGTEYVTDALARQFHHLGHHVVVQTLGCRQPTKPLDLPYPVVWSPKPILPRLFPERIAKHIRRLHEQEKFDLFVSNYAHPGGYAAVRLSEQLDIPTVIISHGGDLYRSSRDRRRPHLWERTLHAYRHADGLVAISPYIGELIREINPQPAHMELIPNGVHLADLARPAPKPADFHDDRPYLLCLGNLGPMKGFADAIDAYAQARDSVAGRSLVIVGSGELEQPLRQQVRRLGLTDDVLFMGKRVGDDKRWFLHHADLGLMPSIEEGHPIVGLEFLAAGKPLICTTNTAFDGMYDDGVNALRVPAQQPTALAEAIRRIMGMDLPAMGEISRQRAQAYDWPLIAGRYLAFFERIIQAREAQ